MGALDFTMKVVGKNSTRWGISKSCHFPQRVLSELIFGKGMRRSTFQWKKGVSVKRGEAIQWIGGLVRISTGKAIQWRGPGHSVNRWTLKSEKLLSSSPSQKLALILNNARPEECVAESPTTASWKSFARHLRSAMRSASFRRTVLPGPCYQRDLPMQGTLCQLVVSVNCPLP